MTLFRQLFVAVSVLFLFLMAVIDVTYVNSSKAYLQEQLTSHSQDVATSLGMVLPASMEAGDSVKMKTTVGAVFDRGYYQSIRVVSVRGETLVLRELAPISPEVPTWFSDRISLHAPSAESLITKGWRQMGRVIVSSHPNFAYKQLWATTKSATLWLLGVYALSLILLHFFLKTILRPLRSIELVAESISERDFKTVENTPRARELRSVVRAINSLSNKIRDFIDKEVELANHYRDEAYQDELTKLSNRRGFEQQIKAILPSTADAESGALYLIHLPGFEEFNAQRGYVEGDRLLGVVARALIGYEESKSLLRARVGGVSFVVVCFNLTQLQAERMGLELCEAVRQAISVAGIAGVGFGCGGVYFGSVRGELGTLMAEADAAMLQSSQQGGGGLVLHLHQISDDEVVKGSRYWKEFILSALEYGRTALYVQAAKSFSGDGVVLQHEVTGRLCAENGEIVPAAQFMPMASRHQLVAAIDRKLLEKLFSLLTKSDGLQGQVAINLSIRSIHEAELVSWLLNTLAVHPNLAKHIVFEFAEFWVVQDLRAVAEFVSKVRKVGADFAVDNFGLHHSAFDYLQTLRPAYIKLSPSFIADIEHSRENQFFISSVVKITKPLEIMTIAHGVETTAQFGALKQLGVDGYQGYATGVPVRLD